jgi:hypothetical protein
VRWVLCLEVEVVSMKEGDAMVGTLRLVGMSLVRVTVATGRSVGSP